MLTIGQYLLISFIHNTTQYTLMKKIILLMFFAVFVSFLFVSCEKESVSIPEKGISKNLSSLRKSIIDSLEYTLFFNIPENKDKDITATAGLKFILNKKVDLPLDFNTENGKVSEVLVGKKRIDFLDSNQHIIIPAKELDSGWVDINIKFIAGNLSLNRNEDFLYTLFVPARASTVFPLFDQPDLKAKYSLTLEIPEEWEAQSNGASIHEEISSNRKTITFAPTKQISSYLFAFSAGRFQKIEREIDGRKLEMLHRETDSVKLADNIDKIFELHASSLNWLEAYTGIKYPFDKFGFSIIPGFQYGGMEHPGAIFYNATSLFPDKNASVNAQLRRASLIAHETAHMWFGDLVTMSWFDDVWLKEVFANFMASKMVNPQYPDINHQLRFTLSYFPAAYSVDRTEGTHPVRQELNNLNKAGSLYGSIIYQKAPILMKHLENFISDSVMQKGLRNYLMQYAYKNATWDELVEVLDNVSKKNVKEWSDKWIYEQGMPVVKVSRDQESLRFIQNENLGSQVIEYFLYSPGGRQDYILIDPSLPQAVIGIEKGTKIIPNVSGIGYGYFPYDSISLLYALNNIDAEKFPIMYAATRINLFEAVLAEHLDPEQLLKNNIRELSKISDLQLLEYMIDQTNFLFWKLLSDQERLTFGKKLEYFYWNRLLMSADADLKHIWYGALRDIMQYEETVEKICDIHTGKLKVEGLVLSENERIDNVCELAMRNAPRWEMHFINLMDSVKNPDRKARMEYLLPALSQKKESRDIFFETLKNAKNREHEPWALAALGYLNHPIRKDEALNYLPAGLELLEEIELTGDIFFPQRWIGALFSGHNSPDAAAVIETFFTEHPDYPPHLKNKIYQETYTTRKAAGIVD